jgi:branched-subunit amino acid aminotransferase/4-amino-4-deoxychorismate lyase
MMRDLSGAVRLFLTNSVRGIIPVRRLTGPGGRVIWQGSGRFSAPEAVLRVWERQMKRDLRHDL